MHILELVVKVGMLRDLNIDRSHRMRNYSCWPLMGWDGVERSADGFQVSKISVEKWKAGR